ncbi:hypothetical protein ACFFUB_02545 [Algimonas porphyrae]|uniref:Uncharacterized protein n=1 Tax=Algimonas porphyrae TaxID=1128113 RepID=A0ABQ5V298_9PROT|nr:hypothetical protein [Algimonas porphyrae]GLQ20362.1 hypothetical protein GCM10007854_13170 [Algimonas porphyrae]
MTGLTHDLYLIQFEADGSYTKPWQAECETPTSLDDVARELSECDGMRLLRVTQICPDHTNRDVTEEALEAFVQRFRDWTASEIIKRCAQIDGRSTTGEWTYGPGYIGLMAEALEAYADALPLSADDRAAAKADAWRDEAKMEVA